MLFSGQIYFQAKQKSDYYIIAHKKSVSFSQFVPKFPVESFMVGLFIYCIFHVKFVVYQMWQQKNQMYI